MGQEGIWIRGPRTSVFWWAQVQREHSMVMEMFHVLIVGVAYTMVLNCQRQTIHLTWVSSITWKFCFKWTWGRWGIFSKYWQCLQYRSKKKNDFYVLCTWKAFEIYFHKHDSFISLIKNEYNDYTKNKISNSYFWAKKCVRKVNNTSTVNELRQGRWRKGRKKGR